MFLTFPVNEHVILITEVFLRIATEIQQLKNLFKLVIFGNKTHFPKIYRN